METPIDAKAREAFEDDLRIAHRDAGEQDGHLTRMLNSVTGGLGQVVASVAPRARLEYASGGELSYELDSATDLEISNYGRDDLAWRVTLRRDGNTELDVTVETPSHLYDVLRHVGRSC